MFILTQFTVCCFNVAFWQTPNNVWRRKIELPYSFCKKGRLTTKMFAKYFIVTRKNVSQAKLTQSTFIEVIGYSISSEIILQNTVDRGKWVHSILFLRLLHTWARYYIFQCEKYDIGKFFIFLKIVTNAEVDKLAEIKSHGRGWNNVSVQCQGMISLRNQYKRRTETLCRTIQNKPNTYEDT